MREINDWSQDQLNILSISRMPRKPSRAIPLWRLFPPGRSFGYNYSLSNSHGVQPAQSVCTLVARRARQILTCVCTADVRPVWNSVWSCDPSGRARTKMKKRGAEQGATSTTHFEAVKRGAGQDHRPNGPSISQVVCAWQLGVGTKHIHNFKYDCGWLLRRGRYHANPRLSCATPTMKP